MRPHSFTASLHKRLAQATTVLLLLVTVLLSSHYAYATEPAVSVRETPEELAGALIISADDLKDMRAQMPGLEMVDTRETQGLTTTITGATHIAERNVTPSMMLSRYPDKQASIVLFGESVRDFNSFKAARKVIGYGYVNVFWLRGGIAEWLSKGYQLGEFKP